MDGFGSILLTADTRGAWTVSDVSIERFADGAVHLRFQFGPGHNTKLAVTDELLAELAGLAGSGEPVAAPEASHPPRATKRPGLALLDAVRLAARGEAHGVRVNSQDLLDVVQALAAWNRLTETDDSSRVFEVVGPAALRAAALAAKAL